ncbi:MAG: MBOAT family protein [Lachnospiraceae bacterium]|nr:MBOAT family protein [Lachnospiraceae bacterium]
MFLFKYIDFSIQVLNSIIDQFGLSISIPKYNLLLPIGISFYIFHSISYLIDVYRREVPAEHSFWKYALFLSFFPQLTAGPIERANSLMQQIDEEHTFDFDAMRNGLLRMLWGYFLKLMIADRAAIFVNAVFDMPSQYEGVFVILAAVLFAVQIYSDLAGYALIAKGAAEVMGFRLTDNFSAPYFSASIGEFWRRWHISLSTWFRDYLYISLGSNRKGKICQYRNVIMVFLAGGLWHGAEASYIVWGLLHSLYLILGDWMEQVFNGRTKQLPKWFRILITFCLVDFAWIFFRADNLQTACDMIVSMFTVHNWSILWDLSIYQPGLGKADFLILLISVLFLFFADFVSCKKIDLRQSIIGKKLWFRWLVYYAAILGMLIFGIWGAENRSMAFLYLQF